MLVFVSHSQDDNAAYTNFCLALDGAGLQRWDVEQMLVGRSLAEQLREAIKVCDVCVFLATQRSVASQWCLAELGAFWGAGKPVMMFLADPNLPVGDLPRQFQGTLHENDARRVIDALGQTPSGVGIDALTPDLVLLLRYLERDHWWTPPDRYGKALAAANGIPENADDQQMRGWKRAANYAFLYLAHQGLAEKQADTAVTYAISAQGRRVLASEPIQQRFRESFERALIPV